MTAKFGQKPYTPFFQRVREPEKEMVDRGERSPPENLLPTGSGLVADVRGKFVDIRLVTFIGREWLRGRVLGNRRGLETFQDDRARERARSFLMYGKIRLAFATQKKWSKEKNALALSFGTGAKAVR